MAKQLYTAVYADKRMYNEGQRFAKHLGAESLQDAETLARRYEDNATLVAIRTPNGVERYEDK